MSSPYETETPQVGTPTIEQGAKGPRGEVGLLLRAPRSEELVWDLETEIASARRTWIEARQAWWIDSSYLETVVAVVLRSSPSVLVLGTNEDRLVSRDGSRAVQHRLL